MSKFCIFHEKVFFSICSSVHIEFSSEKIAESISVKFSQLFCSKSKNENKRLIIQNKVAKNVFLDTQIAVLNSTRSHSTELKKKIFSKFGSPPKCSSQRLGSRCDNSAQCFLPKSKLIENLKNFSFKLLCPQNVPLEMMNANLTILPISFEVAIKFHIMCGNDKVFNFSHKVQLLTLFHLTRKSSLKIVPQGFRSNSKRSHLYENFQRVVFSQKFLWTGRKHFWQAPRKLFLPKVTLRHRSKSGKKGWYLKLPSESFFSICSSVHIEFRSETFAGSISLKLSQKHCSKSENENIRLIFQKKVAGNVLLDTKIAVLNSTRSLSPELKKKILSNFGSPPTCSPRCLGSRCDNSAHFLCSKSKLGENLKNFSFKLLCPQNVPLKMMMIG